MYVYVHVHVYAYVYVHVHVYLYLRVCVDACIGAMGVYLPGVVDISFP